MSSLTIQLVNYESNNSLSVSQTLLTAFMVILESIYDTLHVSYIRRVSIVIVSVSLNNVCDTNQTH